MRWRPFAAVAAALGLIVTLAACNDNGAGVHDAGGVGVITAPSGAPKPTTVITPRPVKKGFADAKARNIAAILLPGLQKLKKEDRHVWEVRTSWTLPDGAEVTAQVTIAGATQAYTKHKRAGPRGKAWSEYFIGPKEGPISVHLSADKPYRYGGVNTLECALYRDGVKMDPPGQTYRQIQSDTHEGKLDCTYPSHEIHFPFP